MTPEDLLIMLIGVENPYWIEAYIDLTQDGIPELWGEVRETSGSLKRSYKFTYTKEGWK